MTTELQLLGEDKIRADVFFDRELIATDWDSIRAQVADGAITKESVLTKIKGYEPMKESDPRDHSHWIDQQVLRLVLLKEDNKPMEGKRICESCGSRRVDALYGDREWRATCLHCAERDHQVPSHGGRGSCEFLQPAYNPKSHSWGLLYYWSHSDHTFLFWAADFYKTRDAAERALWPINFYYRWLDAKYNGMIIHCLGFDDLLPISAMMKLSLPLNPDQFREHLRSAIEIDMIQDQRVMSYYVCEAMDDHERKERDE